MNAASPPPLITRLITRHRAEAHSLPSLVQAVRGLLASAVRPAGDERVTGSPDARTVRYYQSLGLVDRPLRQGGREVVYGYRHLLQAVAVKLLQGQGCSLAQARRALAALPTEALEAAVVLSLQGEAASFQFVIPVEVPPIIQSDGGSFVVSTRALVTREVAPGVLVTVDPRLVPDPDSLLARIAQALHASSAALASPDPASPGATG